PPLRRPPPPLRDRLSLVSPLGAPLGGPAPPHRLAGSLGADPALLSSPTRRGAAVALGVFGDLGAVLRAVPLFSCPDLCLRFPPPKTLTPAPLPSTPSPSPGEGYPAGAFWLFSLFSR